MPEIEGILETVEVINGRLNTKALKIRIGGIDFYKTDWSLKGHNQKFMGLREELAYEEIFPIADFLKEVNEKKGQKVGVRFKEIKISIPYWILNRLHGLRITRNYKEIEDIT